MTIDTKNDFLKVKNFLHIMRKNNKLYDYSMDDVVSYLNTLDKTKYQNKNKKQYLPNTSLDWSIF